MKKKNNTMKLELKHIAPYLPYGLKCLVLNPAEGEEYILEMASCFNHGDELQVALTYSSGNDYGFCSDEFKPILRPMTDLTNEIEVNGEKFMPIEKMSPAPNFFNVEFLQKTPLACSYEVVQKLLEWHFDVFGLIAEGLAVDMNEIK